MKNATLVVCLVIDASAGEWDITVSRVAPELLCS